MRLPVLPSDLIKRRTSSPDPGVDVHQRLLELIGVIYVCITYLYIHRYVYIYIYVYMPCRASFFVAGMF